MTADRPDAKELIEIARVVLNAEILPVLPDESRLTGLMIANALAIAARELAGTSALHPKVASSDIRAGRHDNDHALHQVLLDDARVRVAMSNPRYLAKENP